LLSLLLFPGIFQITFNSNIRDIFRSQSPAFLALEEMSRHFPANEGNLFLAIEGEGLFQSQTLQRLSALHMELLSVDGVQNVTSLFSVRYPPTAKQQASQPVFPFHLDTIEDLVGLKQAFLSHSMVSGILLSKDTTLTLFILSLQPDPSGREPGDLIGAIRQNVDELLAGSGLSYGLTGAPVMQLDIIGALMHDQKIFIGAGFAISLLIAWLFLRHWRDVVIATAPVLIAIGWTLGCMGYMDQSFNLLTNMVPNLIIVISLSESLHLLFAIRRHLERDQDIPKTLATVISEVGPACALAYLTTAIALLTLTLVPYPFISDFGKTAALATVISYFATMTLLPALSILLIQQPKVTNNRTRPNLVRRLSRFVADKVIAHPKGIVSTGIAALLLCGTLYALTQPHYAYHEYLPRGTPSLKAMETINHKLTGTSSMQIFIQWPKGVELSQKERLAVIGDTHRLLEQQPLIKRVWSLYSAAQWLRGESHHEIDVVGFLRAVQPRLITRLISEDGRSALVNGQFANGDVSVLLPILQGIEAGLEPLRQRHAGVELHLTGINPVSSQASHEMISQLNRGLLAAIAVIVILIAYTLRSLRAGMLSIPPNLLPISAAGAYLFLSGEGLQFVSVIAFTLGFGISVDSTIHILNRYQFGREKGQGVAETIHETICLIGPVLIVGTLVLTAGFGVTMLSDMPKVQLFGQISVLLLLVALMGDLVFLPAIILLVDRWRERSHPRP
jgi:hypothetical protein